MAHGATDSQAAQMGQSKTADIPVLAARVCVGWDIGEACYTVFC